MSESIADQYIFFCVNVGNENLLKEEIKAFYPELSLSYSRKGFITYKNKGMKYDLNTISQLLVTFATRAGICLGKAKPEDVKSKVESVFSELEISKNEYMIHNFSINTEYLYDAKSHFDNSINEYSADGKLVLDIISLGEKEVWFGVHRVSSGTTRFPNSNVEIKIPKNTPSIGFRKLAEVKELYALKFKSRDMWIDFGCSPGGSTAFILSTGAKVWGVDTAIVDKSVNSHKNFKLIKSSVQNLSQEQLPDVPISWIHCDLNINPKQAIKEVLRLAKKYNNSLKGIIFTIQVVRVDLINSIEEFEDIFYDWGFSTTGSYQVPSHRKEYVLIATRFKN